MCPSSRQGQILPLFLQPWLALSRRKITQQRSTAAVINPDVSLAALMTTGVNARAHNSLGNASRFISLLRLPSTLIIWVLLSLQGSYAPHALPNNPLVATPPRAHIVCNLSHCSVHVHTTIFDPSSSFSPRSCTFYIFDHGTCASTRYIYIYIYRWFSFFSLDLSLLFHCFARCYARNRSHSSSCRRIDSNARELRGQVSREIQGGTVYHVDALSLDPPVETNAFSLSHIYIEC